MEPHNYPLNRLFGGNLVYVVPNYQRLYVWNREDQWEPLWSDVRDIATSLMANTPDHDYSAAASDATDAHFLGAVVFKISGSTPDLASKFRVIDGQQRLTTLQLLMAAASTALDDHGLTLPAQSLRTLTGNASTTDPLKIEHHRHRRGYDYESFSDVMRAANSASDDSSREGPMGECYRFFREEIDVWLGGHGEHLTAAGSALAAALAFKLRVVAIFLGPHEKEHAIFESLNARGEPLTEWDKIKNYLLYKAEEDHRLDQDEFFEQYLDRFDDPWWRERVGRGVQRPRADVFVDYWLESKTESPVAVRRVFREFQVYVANAADPLDVLMKQLLKDAGYYRESEAVEPTEPTREALFHRRRLALDAGAIWPLLLRLDNLDIDQAEKDRCLAILESYLVRRLIGGYQARSYDRTALELIAVLPAEQGQETTSSEAIRQHLLGYSEYANRWPSDAEMTDAVLTRTLPQYAQRLVLAALEQHLIPRMAGNPDVPAGLHVEHLMPQAWQPETWPLPDGSDSEVAAERREKAIGSLGNLTLLNGRLNSSISNGAWEVKRSRIRKDDNLFLNKFLLEKCHEDEWTEDQIQERGRWMAEEIMKIWPRL